MLAHPLPPGSGAGRAPHQLAHADEILRDFREALLALVDGELGPVDELLVDLGERRFVVAAELHLLPQVARRVRALDRLHEKIAHAVLLADRRVAAVGQRARLAVAHACPAIVSGARARGLHAGGHAPVTLYSLRQKFSRSVLTLKAQKFWLITDQMTSSVCMPMLSLPRK
jgi:hypothetical protein